jgi:hypothetical protein
VKRTGTIHSLDATRTVYTTVQLRELDDGIDRVPDRG